MKISPNQTFPSTLHNRKHIETLPMRHFAETHYEPFTPGRRRPAEKKLIRNETADISKVIIAKVAGDYAKNGGRPSVKNRFRAESIISRIRGH